MIQEILAFTIVAIAILYVMYAVFKSLRKKNDNGCGGSCGCSANKNIGKTKKHKGRENV